MENRTNFADNIVAFGAVVKLLADGVTGADQELDVLEGGLVRYTLRLPRWAKLTHTAMETLAKLSAFAESSDFNRDELYLVYSWTVQPRPRKRGAR